MKTKCSSCNGVYDPVGADGLPYYHVCPPIRRLRVRELDGTYSTVAVGTEGARLVVGDRFFERPNVRDERPVHNPLTGQSDVTAAGAGTTQVADNTVP